ncbi:MAG: CHASE2 domain-containing protein [Gammaproteobacteria bacterium]|nr:CHASE2 domain-containing protein [Gammaproteobacteria bacterium]
MCSRKSKSNIILWFATALYATIATGCSLINEPYAYEPSTLFITIDDETERHLGKFPIDRKYYARAIDKLVEMKAKGVVFKFFLDQSKNKDMDLELASSISRLDTILQYQLKGDSQGSLPASIIADSFPNSPSSSRISGNGNMLPIPLFSSSSASFGFVDANLNEGFDKIELLGNHGDLAVKSLQLKMLELLAGEIAKMKHDQIYVGEQAFPLNDNGQTSCPYLKIGKPKTKSIQSLLQGEIDTKEVAGKIVVIGYDKNDAPKISLSMFEEMGIHQLFYRQLVCLSQMLEH